MQTKQKTGKYVRKSEKKGTLKKMVVGILLIFLIGASAFVLGKSNSGSIYDKLCKDGYSGTQEQWLASLVGEALDCRAESAYSIAQQLGYQETQKKWTETITGFVEVNYDKPAYHIMIENGYKDDITQWLLSISEEPEKLGFSTNDQQKTEYELACEYGYSGSFIQWIVAMVKNPVE